MIHRDWLNEAGEFILGADTRWVVMVVVASLFVFIGTRLVWQRKTITREDAIRLALAFGQLYTALALFSLLVLTKPPAVQLLGDGARQTGGLIIGIFLIAGVIQEVKRTWQH